MTLDMAQDKFKAQPDCDTALGLIKTGIQYWNDVMIDDETFAKECLIPVSNWLLHNEPVLTLVDP